MHVFDHRSKSKEKYVLKNHWGPHLIFESLPTNPSLTGHEISHFINS